MSPSDDYWRHTSPWPGHDAQIPGHDVGGEPSAAFPPLGGYEPPPLINPPMGGAAWTDGSGGGYAGGYAGTGGGRGFAFFAFVIFFLVVPKALALLPVLYPLVAAIELGAVRGAFLLVGKFAPGAPPNTRIGVAAVACLILLWPLARVEQRLASIRAYRLIRHVARLALVGILAYQVTRSMPLAEPLPVWMHPLRGTFRSPAQLAATVGAVVLMQLLLGNFLGIRSIWGRALEFTRLRRA
jgi:hypothetical protein